MRQRSRDGCEIRAEPNFTYVLLAAITSSFNKLEVVNDLPGVKHTLLPHGFLCQFQSFKVAVQYVLCIQVVFLNKIIRWQYIMIPFSQ